MVSLLSLLALLSFCMFLRLAKSNRTRHFPRSLMCIYLSLILENKYHSSMSPSMNEHFVSWIILMQIRHVQRSSSQASLLFIIRITVSSCTYLLQLQLLFAFTFYIIPLSLPPPNTTEPSKKKSRFIPFQVYYLRWRHAVSTRPCSAHLPRSTRNANIM